MLRSQVSSHNRHGPKSGEGCCAPYYGGELGPNLTQCHLGQGLPSWHPDPSSRLATTDIGLKVGAAVSLLWGAGSHLTQCELGRGLPPHQVAP